MKDTYDDADRSSPASGDDDDDDDTMTFGGRRGPGVGRVPTAGLLGPV
jgi:hypothetical protein